MRTARPGKMAPNKTFQVSRQPQYKREKPRSPLASLSETQTVKERILIKDRPFHHRCLNSAEQKASKPAHGDVVLSDQKNSPVVLLVPSAKLVHSGSLSTNANSVAENPKNKELTKVFNRTLSPIGTPEVLKKLMPRIDSGSPQSSAHVGGVAPEPNLPSLNDALALIGSDLSHIDSSPRNTSSSCEFSDSLESKSGNGACGAEAMLASPELPQSHEPRLTFFVSKKVVLKEEKVTEKAKISFTSATVTKTKASVEVGSPGGRKIKKSRRRLLEKTLELSDGGSQSDSGPGTPSLPVIDTETKTTPSDAKHQIPEFTSSSPNSRLPISPLTKTFPTSTLPDTAPSPISFSPTSSPLAIPAPTTPTITSWSSSPPLSSVSMAVSVQEDLFPVQLALKGKKRKSEEYLKTHSKTEDSGKEQVKRNRVGKVDPPPSVRSKRDTSQQQRVVTSE